VVPDTGFSVDENGCLLFAAYEAANAKEQAAAIKLLYSRHRLAHPEYIKLLRELRSIRTECNETMLAIATHRGKTMGIPGVHGGLVEDNGRFFWLRKMYRQFRGVRLERFVNSCTLSMVKKKRAGLDGV
jgi:hypothetical protein